MLDGVLGAQNDQEEPRTHYIGFRETFRVLEKNPQNILCVIACVDNGKDSSLIPRLCWQCHELGVPLILGRDPRRVGGIFQDRKVKRVGCLALTKFAGSKEELLQFVLSLSANSSDVHLALDSDNVRKKFEEMCTGLRGKKVAEENPAPKIEVKLQPTPPKKEQKTGEKKTSFFSNFD